jgi:hypothetical protein
MSSHRCCLGAQLISRRKREKSEAITHCLSSGRPIVRWSGLYYRVRKARHAANAQLHSRDPIQVSSVHIHRVADDVCCSHRQLQMRSQDRWREVPRASAQLHIETFCQTSDSHAIADARPTATTNPATDNRIAAVLLLFQLTRQDDVVSLAWGRPARVFSSNMGIRAGGSVWSWMLQAFR